MSKVLQISELFYSIQGESTRAGLPCAFIRLAGCNLQCAYCDTGYATEGKGRETPLEAIIAWTAAYPSAIVEITGGEPLLQENVYILMDELLARRRTVLVETNGSVGIEKVPVNISVILDFKCPDSGMDGANNWRNAELLLRRAETGSRDEVKFVISSERDFLWAKDKAEQHRLDKAVPVLFSPVAETMPPRRLAELILEYRLPVRLQLQLHRVLWPEKDRGV